MSKCVCSLSAAVLFLASAGAILGQPYTIQTVAGNGQWGFNGDGGLATSTTLFNPSDVVTDAAGNIYIADSGNSRIRKVAVNGIITTAIGKGLCSGWAEGSPAVEAGICYVTALASDSTGNIYLANQGESHRIAKVTPAGIITTVAGGGNNTGEGIPALTARVYLPRGVAVDSTGAVYFSEWNNHRVRKVANGILTTIAGTGVGGYSGDGGPAITAKLNYPSSIAIDSAGNIFIRDDNNFRVRKITPGGQITTFAGGGVGSGIGDGGLATNARLSTGGHLKVDGSGNLLITDTYNYRIRKVNAAGIIYTIAGDGTTGFAGDGGLATNAKFNVPASATPDGFGNIYVADHWNYRIRRMTPSATMSLNPASATISAAGAPVAIQVTASPITQSWTATSYTSWLTVAAGATGVGNGGVTLAAARNLDLGARTGVVMIGWLALTVTQLGAGGSEPVRFTPMEPCRVVDTRPAGGKSGPFGPPNMGARETRDFPLPASPCNITSAAKAYSLNVTVVPHGPLGYLSIWPAGQPQPLVSTLNSFDGRIVANAAIVPAGTNGAISVYTTNAADVIIDINGYFVREGIGQTFPFYTLAPCRIVDTRTGEGIAGAFGPPVMTGLSSRQFPMWNSPNCAIPANSRAYSLNATVVPWEPLGYLTLWPAGVSMPIVSTLNSFDGHVVANAAIVPAGVAGAIQSFVTNTTDLILDINGYFGPDAGGSPLSFYPVTPCRVADTRTGEGRTGPFGPPTPVAGSTRVIPITESTCGIPATARAYSVNITVVPVGTLAYLTAWPSGQAQPLVSTLNSFEGKVLANAAIVPAGTNGAITIFVYDTTDVIVDVNGYFAP